MLMAVFRPEAKFTLFLRTRTQEIAKTFDCFITIFWLY